MKQIEIKDPPCLISNFYMNTSGLINKLKDLDKN